ncbi:MAG: hypothetical protein Aureis2KO_27510 [Aureisphaera sp.]
MLFLGTTNLLGQSCTRLNDISQTADNNSTSSFWIGAAQSWTATCTGQIESIELRTAGFITDGGTTTAQILIIEGNTGAPGSILKNFNYDFVDNEVFGQNHSIAIPGLLNVAASQEYSFVIIQTAENIRFQYTNTDPYDGGNYSRFRDIGDPWSQQPSRDMDFDIRVKDDYPTISCRDITLTLDGNNEASTTFNALTTGSGDDLGVVFRTISQSNFDCDDVGPNKVRLGIQDTGGQNNSCISMVTVVDNNAPELTCPADITVTIEPFETDPVINYDPIGYDDCTVAIDGFTFLMASNGNSYYISDNSFTGPAARADAEAQGGFVATISDSDLNQELLIARDQAGITTTAQWIGISDAAIEGTFEWHGPSTSYTNWGGGGPFNSEDADYVLFGSSGTWFVMGGAATLQYILQVADPTPTITQTSGLASGSNFPVGITTNEFEATDGSGNTGTCSFTVEVIQNPYEVLVELDSGTLRITDIGNTSDMNLVIEENATGNALFLNNLPAAQISTGISRITSTLLSVSKADITNGIEFIGGSGTNTIFFEGDVTLPGSDNDINISGLNASGVAAFENNGHINIGADLTISNSSSAFVLLGELTAVNLSISGVENIRDRVDPSPINISGQTDLQASNRIDILETATHTFAGTVNLESGRVSFHAIGPVNLGAVTTTATDDFFRNDIRIGPGSLNLTGDIVTGGSSDLYLRAQTTINQSGGTITTDNLIFDGRNTGETTAILFGDNDINVIEVATGRSMELIVFNNISDLEIGLLTIDATTVLAPNINLTNNTDIFKNSDGTLSILATNNLNITNATSSLAYITHNGGTIEFGGNAITFEKLWYDAAPGTKTRLLGSTVFNPIDFFAEFGTLELQAPLDIGSTGFTINILDELKVNRFEAVLSGTGTFTGGSTSVELDGTIAPGNGTSPATLAITSVEFDEGTYAPFIESNSAYDQLNVVGSVTLTNADFNPTGGFTPQASDLEMVLINNDGTDLVSGTFNGLSEGSIVTFGDYAGFISYVGGDGNDVVLLPDTVDPVAVCQDISLSIDLGGVTVTPDMIDNGSSDNVAIANLLINGQSQVDFAYTDLGSNDVTLTVVDTSGNTDECTATVTLTSGATLPVLISEYQPDTTNDPQSIEIIGEPGEGFTGFFVVIEGDTDTSDIGVIKSADSFSGTFDGNGLLVASIPNINNPTHTVVLTTAFSGTANVTDIDADDDGTADDLSAFGLILDAIGVGDGGACCPLDFLYGTDFGGINLPGIGGIPGAIFREGSTGDFYQILASNGNIYDNTGTLVNAAIFDITPTSSGTFGAINPKAILTGTDAFVTTWKTDNNGNSNDDQIAIYTDNTLTYDYVVDWGDGTIQSGITGDVTHTYSSGAGTYTIRIAGTFPRFISNGSFFGDAEKLISIDQWGTNSWTSFADAFYECENMDVLATDIPDLSNVTSMFSMFGNCHALTGNATINNWDVSNVENMQLLFIAANNFNQPLDNWNVGNVTNMESMFNGAETFNQDLNSWNTSQVETMRFMFTGALDFNGAIGNWNVSNVTDMGWMFNNAEDFNQDLNSWNVSQVQDMFFMFLAATNFNGNISNWNPAQVTTMYGMFQNAVNFNQNISGWNVGQVTDMGWMFNGATLYNQPIGNWDVSNVGVATEMLIGTAFSTENYDDLLIQWDMLTLKNNVSFGTDASFCLGETAKQNIITNHNWSFTDGDLNCSNCAGGSTIWNGTSWDNGVPDSTIEAIIAADYSTSTADIQACELVVNSGFVLSIGANEFIEVQGNITVNGSLIVAHQGSVVQVDDTATVTNSGTINVNVTTPVLQTRDFMVLGSPMSAETRTDVYGTAFLVLDHVPENFIPHPDVDPGGTNFADDDGDFWTQMASGSIDSGRGYIVRPQDSYTDPADEPYFFTHALGTLNNGITTKTSVYNGTSNPDGTPNVYANPYASAISADDFITANPLVTELYFWEHLTPPSASIPGANGTNFSMDDISMYNLSGGVAAANDPTGIDTAPNGMIATSQGFGVKAFAGGNITFSNNMRRTTGNTTLRLTDNIDKIWLQLTNLEYDLGSNTLVAFNPLASESLDSGYDSNRLATAISLYSHLEDGSEQLGIQTLGAFSSEAKIPMGFSSVVKERVTYSISIANMEGTSITQATVYLTDNYLNETVILSDGDYYFESEAGNLEGRFTLSFEEPIVLSTNDAALQKISVTPNPTHGLLNIQSPMGIQDVKVYDLQGRIVLEAAGNGLENLEVNLENMSSAVYLVKIHTENGTVTKRVIKE